mmetsp:Transcript_13676/g.47697  ORF Transcript_13676/g.47697 Transcript_13676/m.47697 type:complete len:238 (+) Transcript_13676:472-1185(+)
MICCATLPYATSSLSLLCRAAPTARTASLNSGKPMRRLPVLLTRAKSRSAAVRSKRFLCLSRPQSVSSLIHCTLSSSAAVEPCVCEKAPNSRNTALSVPGSARSASSVVRANVSDATAVVLTASTPERRFSRRSSLALRSASCLAMSSARRTLSAVVAAAATGPPVAMIMSAACAYAAAGDSSAKKAAASSRSASQLCSNPIFLAPRVHTLVNPSSACVALKARGRASRPQSRSMRM